MAPATAAALTDSDMIDVPSQLLGQVSVPESHVFEFDGGIYGFPQARTFALLPTERDGLFWLQSVDFDALTFLVADPFPLVSGYSVEVESGEIAGFEFDDPAHLLVLATVTLPRTQDEATTLNLQGPFVLDVMGRRGRQIVVESSFGVRHPVDL